jgi:hypothetical protein
MLLTLKYLHLNYIIFNFKGKPNFLLTVNQMILF